MYTEESQDITSDSREIPKGNPYIDTGPVTSQSEPASSTVDISTDNSVDTNTSSCPQNLSGATPTRVASSRIKTPEKVKESKTVIQTPRRSGRVRKAPDKLNLKIKDTHKRLIMHDKCSA